MHDHCDKILKTNTHDQCRTLIKLYTHTLAQININQNHLLEMFEAPKSRRKRGLMNGIGKLQHLLFGVMDSDNARIVDKALKNLETNQENLLHLENKQITIITDILDDLNSTKTVMNANLNNFMSNLKKVYEKSNNQSQQNFVNHEFEKTSQILHVCALALLEKQNDLIDNFQKARLGKLNTHFLNSDTFSKALKHIQLEQIENIKFPFNLNSLNLQLLNSIVKVKPIYSKNTLFIQVDIPLVSGQFELYRLTSLPIRLEKNTILLRQTMNIWQSTRTCKNICF